MQAFNAADFILRHVDRLETKVALQYQPAAGASVEVTYGALGAAVDRVANVLVARGLKAGERVMVLMNDSPRYYAAFLGAMKAGGVPIALNTRLSEADYTFVLTDSGAAIALVDDVFAPILKRARDAMTGDRAAPMFIRATSLDAACDSAPSAFATVPMHADAPAFWLYSSGTTGRPKGIIHSHASCASAGKLMREWLQADEHFRVFSTSKLFFAFALESVFLGALSLGATSLVNEAWAEPEAVLAQVERFRPDIFFTVPTMFRRLLTLDAERLKPFSAVRYHYTGGERLPDAVAARWEVATGREVFECYCMSETFCNTLANRPGVRRVGSCGQLLANVEARLLDTSGAPARADEPGILWIKHPTLTIGYNKMPADHPSFRDGWFCTNDRFVRDADGFFWHQGRADELLKVAGQWVKPGEVEEAALSSGAAREAACVVVPDADGFERLALFVVPTDASRSALAATIAATAAQLPRHSQPKWIREVAELPRTPTGKVQRYRLREALILELGSPPEIS
ncbi:MAG: AMP-binding protein [Burkholderiales bacterium]